MIETTEVLEGTIENNQVLEGEIESSSSGDYKLPIASNEVLGGIKVGENLTIDEDGTLNAQASGGDTLPINAIFEYEGDVVPEGYEEVEEEPSIDGGSGGREYSTEERVVGVWKNGKPLYGKLIEIPAPETENDGEFVYVDVPIENCDYCFIEWTTITDKEGNQVTFPYFTNAGYSIKSYFSGYSRGVRIVNGVTNYNSCPVTASVLYTKTTD